MKSRTQLLIAFAAVLGLAAPGPRSAAAEAQKRTLTRTEDFIVVAGKDVPALKGAAVKSLQAFACAAGKCKNIPFQADKIDSLGRYVFPADKNADRDGDKLDDNDELSFMASDAGDPAPPGFKPDGAARAVTLLITDPLDQTTAWVYVFEVPNVPPPKTDDYIDYVISGGKALLKSPQYELGWDEGMINANVMRLTTPSGKLSGDILDRQRVGLEAQLSGERSLPINAPESLIQAKDLAVIDGPIRVIIDQIIVIRLANLDIKWGTEYFVRYYRCGQNNSVNFNFPTATTVFKSIAMYWSLDFAPDMIGSFYVDPVQASPIPITPDNKSGVPNDGPHFWYGVYGKNGAVFEALKLDDDILAFLTCSARWDQDANARDRKGDIPGLLDIGFNCAPKGKIPEKKAYHWLNYILIPKDPSAKGIKAMQNLVEHPLKVAAAPAP